MNKINHDYIISYLRNTLRQSEGILAELEEYAHANGVPVIEKESAEFLRVLLTILKPKKILEIGTAIGYSAILMNMASGGAVVSIEKDEQMYKMALENIQRCNADVNVIFGDALDEIEKLNDTFDLVFIDAAKGQYRKFFDMSVNKLSENGVVICDNVLFKGMIASDELATDKSKTIVRRLREFLSFLCENYDTSILPVGDGVAIVSGAGKAFNERS